MHAADKVGISVVVGAGRDHTCLPSQRRIFPALRGVFYYEPCRPCHPFTQEKSPLRSGVRSLQRTRAQALALSHVPPFPGCDQGVSFVFLSLFLPLKEETPGKRVVLLFTCAAALDTSNKRHRQANVHTRLCNPEVH